MRKKVLQGLGLADVRIAGSGSAPLPADLIEWYDRLGVPIIEGYGMTEDFAYSHMSTPDNRKPGYVGVAWHSWSGGGFDAERNGATAAGVMYAARADLGVAQWAASFVRRPAPLPRYTHGLPH